MFGSSLPSVVCSMVVVYRVRIDLLPHMLNYFHDIYFVLDMKRHFQLYFIHIMVIGCTRETVVRGLPQVTVELYH
jgi:hypothetical protein